MRVILAENLPNLGSVGDIVSVKDGYARNFLFPRSFAVLANESHRKDFAHKQRLMEKKKQKILAAVKSMAKKIEKIKLSVQKQIGEEDRIFGSVTATEISALLAQQNVVVDKRVISFPTEIKKLGDYTIYANLHPEVTAKLKISVVQ